jgi:hypothetical protein
LRLFYEKKNISVVCLFGGREGLLLPVGILPCGTRRAVRAERERVHVFLKHHKIVSNNAETREKEHFLMSDIKIRREEEEEEKLAKLKKHTRAGERRRQEEEEVGGG